MPVHYDSPRQRPAYPPDNEYRPPPQPVASGHQEYSGYPPRANFTNEQSQPLNERLYDPNPLSSMPPHETINGTALRGRTPSPTPSELRGMKSGVIDWKTLSNWRFWIRKDWIWYYVALVVILVLVILMTVFHEQIVHWLTPVTRWLHDLSFGWLVPIAVLFVISFPPLFGHEIVAILCGLVWGMWIGFAIVAAGTFLGEVGNYYAFKYCCRSRSEKHERTSIWYGCLAKVVRDGGFKIALIARLSAIPGHFTTAVFATCGMGIFVFSLAAILSMPKQFITVYLGVILEQSTEGTRDPKSRIISDIVLAITILITILAMWYIFHQMNKVKPAVIYARRKARQAKLEGQFGLAGTNGHTRNQSYATLATMDYSYANESESEIPLTSRAMPMGSAPVFPEPKHFQEESSGNLYDPPLHAPKPQRAGQQIPRLEYEASGSAERLQSTPEKPYGEPELQNASPYQPGVHTPAVHGLSDQIQPPVNIYTHEAPVLSARSDSPYETGGVGSLQPEQSTPPPNYPLRSSPQPSPGQHTHPRRLYGRDQTSPPRMTGSTDDTSDFQNPFAPAFDDLSLVPAPPRHVPEETQDSFHTARMGSPEPVTENDPRSWTPQPLPSQQRIYANHEPTNPQGQGRWNQQTSHHTASR